MKDFVEIFEATIDKDKMLRETILKRNNKPKNNIASADISDLLDIEYLKSIIANKSDIDIQENKLLKNNKAITKIRDEIRITLSEMSKDEALSQMASILTLLKNLDSDMVKMIQVKIMEKTK